MYDYMSKDSISATMFNTIVSVISRLHRKFYLFCELSNGLKTFLCMFQVAKGQGNLKHEAQLLLFVYCTGSLISVVFC